MSVEVLVTLVSWLPLVMSAGTTFNGEGGVDHQDAKEG